MDSSIVKAGEMAVRKGCIIAFVFLFSLAYSQVDVCAQDEFGDGLPFDPFTFELSFPSNFGGGTLIKELYRAEGVSAATAVADSFGTFFYIVSDREAVLASTGTTEWDALGTVTYPFFIYAVSPSGIPFVFAWGSLPLKAYPAGLMFDPANDGRLMVFVRTLAVDVENCSFLLFNADDSSTPAEPQDQPRSGILPSQSSNTGAWDLTGLEQCFYEKVSIIQISGQFAVLPEVVTYPGEDQP
jgi:hypothetical protein